METSTMAREAGAEAPREIPLDDPGRAILEVGTATAAGAVAGRLLAGRAGTFVGALLGAAAGTFLALGRLAGGRAPGPGPERRPPEASPTPRKAPASPKRPAGAGADGARRDGGAGRKKPAVASKVAARRRLAGHTRDELYEKARELEIPGRSRMKKDELVSALLERGVTDLDG